MNLSELRTALQERREDYSSTDGKLDRKINQAYLDICSRRKWGWLRRPYTYATYAPDTTRYQVSDVYDGEVEIKVTRQDGTMPAGLLPTTMGKLLKIQGNYYRLENILEDDTHWVLDRPLRMNSPITATPQAISIYYDDVALPVGALSVLETVLSEGSASYPSPLNAVSPADMATMDKGVSGRPTRFSTVRKEPIPPPIHSPSGFETNEATSGEGLTLGATYTYWLTHIDKQTGAESALGPSASIVSGGTSGAISVTTGEARSDYLLRLYRSRANGDVPFLLADQREPYVRDDPTLPGWTDNVPDHHLGVRGPASASSLYLQLHPIPDSEYEVHSLIQMEAKRLSGDNDRPLFDAQFHHVILDGAEGYMMDASDEQGRAASARQRFEGGIARMIQQDRLNTQYRIVMGGRRVPVGNPTWWYGSMPPYDPAWSVK